MAKSDEYAKAAENYEVAKGRNYFLLLILVIIVVGVGYAINASGGEGAGKEKGSRLGTAHKRKRK